MGIGVRTLEDLQNECVLLGLTPIASNGKKLLKRDYVKSLRDHYLAKEYPSGVIPSHLQYMIDLDTPMLCAQMSTLKPKEQAAIWEDPNVVAQRKLDGVRMILVFNELDGLHFYSRNISVTNYAPQNYVGNVDLWDFRPEVLRNLGVKSFVLDTEIVCPKARVNTLKDSLQKKGVITETVLQAVSALLALNQEDSANIQHQQNIRLEFLAFHLLEFNGRDFRKEPLHRVLPELTKVIDLVQQSGLAVQHVPTVSEGKRQYYESIVTSGGEGVVLKRLDSIYRNTESRAHREWVKAKTTVSQALVKAGLGDTVDAFVTGWGRGEGDSSFRDMVGYLVFSVWLLKPDGTRVQHEIAHTANLPLDERKKISVTGPDGNLTLDPLYLGKVGVIDGQGISPRARRLTHPRLIEWRMGDKQADACVMEEAFLDTLVGSDNTAGGSPVTEVGF